MARSKSLIHDWPAIRASYVEGWQDAEGRHFPTYREVARKHGINVSYLRARAGPENWTNERAHFQATTDQARQKKLTAIVAAAGADFDSRCLRTAKTQLRINRAIMAQVIVEARKPGADERMATCCQSPQRTVHDGAIGASLVRVQHVGRVAIGASGDDGLEDWIPSVPRSLSFTRVDREANEIIDSDAA